MELIYQNAKEIKDIFKTLNVLNSEPILNFNYDGLTSQLMDPSHVAMIQLNLSKKCFDEYNIDEPLKTCLNLDNLVKKVFRNINNDDMLKLDIKDDKATFTLISDLNRSFKMSTLEFDGELPPAPKINYEVTVKIALKSLDRIIKDLKGLTEEINLTGEKDQIVFSAVLDGDKEKYSVTIDNRNINLLRYNNCYGNIQVAKYSLTYLSDIVKALKPLTDVIEISFSKDMPLQIKIYFDNYGDLTYWMAPRIHND